MRILHLITSFDLRGGGPAEVVRLLGKTQVAQGHTVEAVSSDNESLDVSAFEFPVHRLGKGGGYGYSKQIAEWLQQNRSRFDVAIVHGLWQYPLHGAYTLLRGHLPYFVYTHGMLDPWFNQSFRLKHMKKLLYWHWMGERSLNAASALIFTTDVEMQRSSTAFFPYKWKAFVSSLGIDGPTAPINQAQLYVRWPELEKRKYILFFGRLHPKKGCDLLLKAFASTGTAKSHLLVMAGPADPAYGRELRSLAQQLEIQDRIVWTGMVQGNEKWAMLQQADAFILPSHQENFAIAAAEAMCCGTPVLLSDKVQICNDVRRAGAGLVEPDTVEGTEHLLQGWTGLSQEAAAAMRSDARLAYEQMYTTHASATHLMQQIEAVLRSANRVSHLPRKATSSLTVQRA